MTLVNKINKTSFKTLIGLLIIFGIQLLIKYVFLKPQVASLSKNKNFIISRIKKNTIQKITIKSPELKVSLFKSNKGWMLKTPRIYPANIKFINSLIDQMLTIKVNDVLTKDLINISNYSLENPNLKISFTNHSDTYQFKFGIFNTIIDSTYLLFSNQNVIYKTNIPNILKSKINLSQIINTNIFQENLSHLTELKLYYGKKEQNKIALKLSLKQGKTWVGKKGRILDSQLVSNRLQNLLNVKSHLIFDIINSDQKKIIKRRLAFPRYSIELTSNNKKSLYKISYLLPSIKKLKLKENEFFIISNDQTFPFLVRKKFMKIFEQRESVLRAKKIKKLYY